MYAFGFWPVSVVPVGPVACATMLWRMAGQLHVTAVVKATFAFEQNNFMSVCSPEPVRVDQGDLAPYLRQVDVVITSAHAHPHGAQPAEAVATRLALIREWPPTIDKRLLVYKHSAPVDDDHSFIRAVLVSRNPREQLGMIVDPQAPDAAVGYGPLTEAARRAMLGTVAPPFERDSVFELADNMPWEYYQIAPPDQRIEQLFGDEWVMLDGMHPSYPRLQSRLPGAQAEVRVYPPGRRATTGPKYRVPMHCDRLSIDGDAMHCTLHWRGNFPVADLAAVRALTLVATVLLPGQESTWKLEADTIDSPLRRTGSFRAIDPNQLAQAAYSVPAPRPPADTRQPAPSACAEPSEVRPAPSAVRPSEVRPAPSAVGPSEVRPAAPPAAWSQVRPPSGPLVIRDEISVDDQAETHRMSALHVRRALAESEEEYVDISEMAELVGGDDGAVYSGYPSSGAAAAPARVSPAGGLEAVVIDEDTTALEEIADAEPPELPAATVRELEQTLSGVLEAKGLAADEKLSGLSWRLPQPHKPQGSSEPQGS